MITKLGDVITEYSVRNKNKENIPVYSVTNEQGFCTGYFSKDVASKDRTTYKIVPKGYFAYNPSRINVGSVDWQDCEERVIVSPLYVVFGVNKNLDQQYLLHYLKSDIALTYIKAFATGSVRDNLKFSVLQELPINLRPIDEQRKIASVLDHINRVIELRKKELSTLDALIKSRFIELFGMPGADDFGWGLVPLGSVCYINPKKGQDPRLNSGVEVSFVPMPAVTERGEIDATAIKEYDEVKTGFTYFAENDVLFAKITPCMENGKGAVARGLHNGLGFGSTEFHVLRPIIGKSNPYWIYTLTAFSQFREDAASNMTGSAGQRRVPASFLENYRVALPPIELQEQFATFIEQTDKSKLAVQQGLQELEILKKSLMQQYFG